MKAMILAAGRGVRMGALTENCPKPLLPILGKPLLFWHLEKLAALGIHDVVINCAYRGEDIIAAAGTGERWGLRIAYSLEPEGALETAGGIAQALPLLGSDPFLLINADVWLSHLPLAYVPQELMSAQKTAHLYLVDNPPHHTAGDFYLHGREVKMVGEGARLTFSGVSIFVPLFFFDVAAGARAPLAPYLRRAIEKNQVSGEKLPSEWVDVGTPERLHDAEQLAAKSN